MPIYEFECNNCKYGFELRRIISEMDSATMCPFCGSNNTQRKFPTSTIYFSTDKKHNTSNINNSPNIVMDNIEIDGCKTGIKVKNVRIKGRNIRMKDTQVGIDAEDSDIAIKDLSIE